MSEEGEFSGFSGTETEDSLAISTADNDKENQISHKVKVKKTKRRSRYSLLEDRFSRLEDLVTKALSKDTGTNSAVVNVEPETNVVSGQVTNSPKHDMDVLSLLAMDNDFQDGDIDDIESKDDNEPGNAKKCLFEMFGDDATVKKPVEKKGLMLDEAQVQVIENSFRCKEPNFLTAFSEENNDIFSVDSDSEKHFKVPSLDSLVDSCLTRRYGSKASFAKNKGKVLYTQPCKLVDKIGFKGQHAARMGMVMTCYLQQSLAGLLEKVEADDFDKDSVVQHIKDTFSVSTKVLDQLGRTGAFHHIIRRAVAMTDTGLYDQQDNLEFSNLPLSGEGVFGDQLETLLKTRKEKRKQLDDLLPEVKFSGKRKSSGYDTNNKRPAYGNKQSDKPANNSWGNFRIPKSPSNSNRGQRSNYRGASRGRSSYSSYSRRPSATPSRGRVEQPADK